MPTNIFYPPLSNIVLPSDWPEELSFIEVGLTGVLFGQNSEIVTNDLKIISSKINQLISDLFDNSIIYNEYSQMKQ